MQMGEKRRCYYISSCYQECRNSTLLKQIKLLVLIPPIGLVKPDSCFGNGIGVVHKRPTSSPERPTTTRSSMWLELQHQCFPPTNHLLTAISQHVALPSTPSLRLRNRRPRPLWRSLQPPLPPAPQPAPSRQQLQPHLVLLFSKQRLDLLAIPEQCANACSNQPRWSECQSCQADDDG